MRPSPEEQARLKAEKDAKKAAKKAKFGAINEEKNLPVVEVRLPWVSEGRSIDIDRPPWDSYVDACVEAYRMEGCYGAVTDYSKKYTGPVKVKLIRT